MRLASASFLKLWDQTVLASKRPVMVITDETIPVSTTIEEACLVCAAMGSLRVIRSHPRLRREGFDSQCLSKEQLYATFDLSDHL